MLLFLFSIITISTYHWEKFSHPKPKDLYKELSENLREEVKHNFNTLQTIKYEMAYIKEDLYNNSRIVKNTLLSHKMKNKRKMDLLFARYAHMVKRVHQKSEYNLDILENNRKRVSDNLSDLKRYHLSMINRLNKNQEGIDNDYQDKKDRHMNTMEDKYIEWKNKREEILDTINGL